MKQDWVEHQMLSEFKDFIAKGNVMDMAVGIIIGAAFTAIVGSLVADLINPIISLAMGGVDFSGLFVLLGEGEFASIDAADEAGAAVFAYGRFIMAIINFLIIAFVVFLLVKAVNKAKGPEEEEEEEEAGPTQEELLAEIRDALKARG
jgi:large conductance mechanosensitive channel